jgi:hypothetical protein
MGHGAQPTTNFILIRRLIRAFQFDGQEPAVRGVFLAGFAALAARQTTFGGRAT